MATQRLEIGEGAANSDDVTVAAGETLTVALNDTDSELNSGATVYVKVKDPDDRYMTIGELTAANPCQVIMGAGTYQFSRPASSARCGVFSA